MNYDVVNLVKFGFFFVIDRNVSPAAVTEDTITEKLQQQESRQAELNHYVKMVNVFKKTVNTLFCPLFFSLNLFYYWQTHYSNFFIF